MGETLFELLLDIVADKDMYVDGSKYYFPNRTIEIIKKDDSLANRIEFLLQDIIQAARRYGICSFVRDKVEEFESIVLLYKDALVTTSVILLDKLYGFRFKFYVGQYIYYFNTRGMLSTGHGELKVSLTDKVFEYITSVVKVSKDKIVLRQFTKKELDEIHTNHEFLQFIVPPDELRDEASTSRNVIDTISEEIFRDLKYKFMHDIDNCTESNTKLDIGTILMKYRKDISRNDSYMAFLFAVVKYIYGVDITVDELDEISIACKINDLYRDYNYIAEMNTSKRSYGLYKRAHSYNYKALKSIVKALKDMESRQDKKYEDSSDGAWDTFCEEHGK